MLTTNDVTSYLSNHARSARWRFTPRRCSRLCKLWLKQPVVSLGPCVWEWRIASNAFISLDCGETSVSCRNWWASNRLMGADMARRGGLIDASVCKLLLSALVLIRRQNRQILQELFSLLFIDWTICRPAGSHLVSSRQSRLLLCSAQRLHGESGGGVRQQPTEDAPRTRSARPQRRHGSQRCLPGGLWCLYFFRHKCHQNSYIPCRTWTQSFNWPLVIMGCKMQLTNEIGRLLFP